MSQINFVGTHFVSKLQYLSHSNLSDHSDVKLISSDGQCFFSSRLILSGSSQMFYNLFLDDQELAEDVTTVITEFSSNCLRNLIDFVSRGLLFVSCSEETISTEKNVEIDEHLLADFLSFGIDLASLQMDSVDENELEKFFDFESEENESSNCLSEFVEQFDVKEEQLENVEVNHQSNLVKSNDTVKTDSEDKNLKKKVGRPRKVEKKSLKTTKKNIKLKKIAKSISSQNLQRRPTRCSLPIEEEELEQSDDDVNDQEEDEDDDRNDLKDPDFEPAGEDVVKKEAGKRGRPRKHNVIDVDKNDSKDPDFKPEEKEVGKNDAVKKGRPRKYNVKPLGCSLEGERNLSKKFQCLHCIKGFNCRKTFKLHVLRHEAGAGLKVFFCFQCGKDTSFPTNEELKEHRFEFHTNKTYTCDRCGKVFSGKYYDRFKRHLSTHDANAVRRFTCVACGYITKSSDCLNRHMNTFGPFHNGKCNLCPEEFKSWSDHENHVNQVHSGRMLVRCGICDQTFDTIERQRIHRRDQHFKEERSKRPPDDSRANNVVCQFCGKLVKATYYDSHLENKHSSGEHPCPECGKVLNHPAVLERHLANYHNPFPCEKCGKTIRSHQAYRRHNLSVHTLDHLKPHQCTMCDPARGFHTLKNLRDHMNVHTNERPYKCSLCTAAFNSEANMFAHVRSTHKGIKRKGKKKR